MILTPSFSFAAVRTVRHTAAPIKGDRFRHRPCVCMFQAFAGITRRDAI
jgi:hypothetical protein